ncbi:MAG: DUF5717 family protein [Lachnospiraceae bacterium]|nr:DUF5717 family protein [Lachnospiraceae bacterium]
MKEKIGLFARGIFSYERPALSLSVEKLNLSVSTGSKVRGSFIVSSKGSAPFKGIAFCDESLLTFDDPSFCGKENTLTFTIDATHLDAGDKLKGSIVLVTELGEAHIPFNCLVSSLSCTSSLGPVSDIFQFANLAQTDWTEAKNLFRSDIFSSVFSKASKKAELAIRALKGCNNISLAVEEFLIALRKKHVVSVSVDRNEIEFDSPEESEGGCMLTLTKDSWGYVQLGCESEGDFIKPGARVIWTDDFEGNTCSLTFEIDKEKLRPGRNYGSLTLSSLRADNVIDITCRRESAKRRTLLIKSRIRHDMISVVVAYVRYRFGKIPAGRFTAEVETVLEGLKPLRDESVYDRLLYIYALAVSGKAFKADTLLRAVLDEEEWRGADPKIYGSVLYLEAIIRREDPRAVTEQLRRVYEQSGDPFIMVLCILSDDLQTILPEHAYEMLKESSQSSILSIPVITEAALIITRRPEVVRDMGVFDVKAIDMALENRALQKKGAQTLAYTASRCKKAGRIHINVFEKLYNQFPLPEILEALCHVITVSDERSARTYGILLEGCRGHIKEPGIFEECVRSLAAASDTEIADQILVAYFEKGINIGDDVKAAFFANVARNRSRIQGISPSFNMMMREFAIAGMREAMTDDDHAALYNDLHGLEKLPGDAVAMLPQIVFKRKITGIGMPHAAYVVVIHRQIAGEHRYPVINGEALIDIYTDDYILCFEDADGSRLLECKHEMSRLITNDELLDFCLENCTDDEFVALHLCVSKKTIEATRRCRENEDLSEEFRIVCTKRLIGYYYENLQGEIMESYLVGLDLSRLSRIERGTMIELMINRELYSLAFKNIELFGCYEIDERKLSRLVSKLLASHSEVDDRKLLISICATVFKAGKADKNILSFLEANYNGDCETTYAIWKSSVDEGIDTMDIEERLLAQLLFTESDMNYSRTVFKHYYSHCGSDRIVKAFISYYAYGCLLYDRPPDEEMMILMMRECEREQNDVCVLALLKIYSTRTSFTEQEKLFIEKELELMEGKNRVFPFFSKFSGQISVPHTIRDRYYIEYHTEPGKQVFIDYRICKGGAPGEFTHEQMRDSGYGIFVKEITLFCDESVQYYITEGIGETRQITQSCVEYMQASDTEKNTSRYERLSLIIEAEKMHDRETLIKALGDYLKNDYLCRKLFDPIA